MTLNAAVSYKTGLNVILAWSDLPRHMVLSWKCETFVFSWTESFKLFFSTLDGVTETDRMSPLRSSLSQVKSVCHYLIS